MNAHHSPAAPLRVISASLCLVAFGASPARAETVTAEPDALLEYVETPQHASNNDTVTQYIDTGVKAETGLKARMDAVILSSTRSDSAILGARYNSDRRFLMLHNNSSFTWAAYGKGNDGKWTDSANRKGVRQEQLADFSDGSAVQVYVNGEPRISQTKQSVLKSVAEDASTGAISASWMGNLTLYLFAANNGGTAAWPSRIRLFELKILKKNASTGGFDLLRHYLPCVKDGRAGLYDKANGTISYSDGSADLEAGPVLDKPLDFVESLTSVSGDGGQYFDTWVYGKSGLKSEVDVSVRDYSGDHAILASRGNDGTSANNTRLYMAYHYQQAFRFAHGTLPGKGDINVVVPTNNVLSDARNDVRYRIFCDTTAGAQSMTVSRNGGEPEQLLKSGTDYGSTYLATTNTLYLLAIHKFDGYPTCPSSCVLYGAKIWDGDELLRDFVPVVATNESGVAYAGLYDQVARRVHRPMLANVKGGRDNPLDLATWQVGAVTNTLRAVEGPATRLEYVESDGEFDFVNLGVAASDGLEMTATMDWLTVPSDERAFVGARNTTSARFFPYSTYSGGGAIQHAFHYAGSRYIAKTDGGAGSGIDVAANATYKVATRLEAGAQRIDLWRLDGDAWTKLGERAASIAGPVSTGLPLYLFMADAEGLPRFPVHARCRALRLSVRRQDGTYALARDLIPVRDPVTGGAALWDRVSERYFRNGGKYMISGGGEERPMVLPFVMVVR